MPRDHVMILIGQLGGFCTLGIAQREALSLLARGYIWGGVRKGPPPGGAPGRRVC